MTISNIELIGKDQNFQDESTTYWFDFDLDGRHTTGGIVESADYEPVLIDVDGYPMTEWHEHNEIKAALVVTHEMRMDF